MSPSYYRMAEAGLYKDVEKGIFRPGTPELRAKDQELDGIVRRGDLRRSRPPQPVQGRPGGAARLSPHLCGVGRRLHEEGAGAIRRADTA